MDAVRPRLAPPLALVAAASLEHLRAASERLREMGFRILMTRSVGDGGGVAARTGGPVDLLAVDAEVSDPAVGRLVATLRESCPGLSILYLSEASHPAPGVLAGTPGRLGGWSQSPHDC
jgi:hypothetical protein